MSPETVEECDMEPAGGGPAGSTLASFVAMHRHRTLILEKKTFPRYQIGESLLTPTAHPVCPADRGRTGVADALSRAGFTKRRGGTLKWGTNLEQWTFSFSVSPNIAGDNGCPLS